MLIINVLSIIMKNDAHLKGRVVNLIGGWTDIGLLILGSWIPATNGINNINVLLMVP